MSASFYDLLKYAKTGLASPEMTAYDKMRALAMAGGGAVHTLTGVPPLSFRANGKPLISWSMKGNTQQTGTPSPDNIIMPDFCGVRTGNLFDKDKKTDNSRVLYTTGEVNPLLPHGVFVSDFTSIEPNTAYTLNIVSSISGKTGHLFALYDENKNFVYTGVHEATTATVYTFTTPSNVAYIRFNGDMSSADSTMLNLGSTALPYEPYGWKIPITNAGQTVPVYLGEVPTVRRIRKLVLTGEENWILLDLGSETYMRFYYNLPDDEAAVFKDDAICSHFPITQINEHEGFKFSIQSRLYNQPVCTVLKSRLTANDIASWKSYLAAQYAAGTPVTVWYVLKEPTTGIVNEPLAKIGDYADELHSEDAGVSIPTAKGANTLTVGTELQPSEMTITYRG